MEHHNILSGFRRTALIYKSLSVKWILKVARTLCPPQLVRDWRVTKKADCRANFLATECTWIEKISINSKWRETHKDTQESEYQFWKRILFPTERRITKFKKSGPILSKIRTKSGPRRWKSEPKILLGTVRQVGFFSRVATGQAVGVKQLLKSWQHPFGLYHLKYLVASAA